MNTSTPAINTSIRRSGSPAPVAASAQTQSGRSALARSSGKKTTQDQESGTGSTSTTDTPDGTQVARGDGVNSTPQTQTSNNATSVSRTNGVLNQGSSGSNLASLLGTGSLNGNGDVVSRLLGTVMPFQAIRGLTDTMQGLITQRSNNNPVNPFANNFANPNNPTQPNRPITPGSPEEKQLALKDAIRKDIERAHDRGFGQQDFERVKGLAEANKGLGLSTNDLRRLAVHQVESEAVKKASLKGQDKDSQAITISGLISSSNEAKLSDLEKKTLATLGIGTGDFHQATAAQYKASAENFNKISPNTDLKDHVLFITSNTKDGRFDHAKEIADLQKAGKTVIIAQADSDQGLGDILKNFKGKQFGTVVLAGHGGVDNPGLAWDPSQRESDGKVKAIHALNPLDTGLIDSIKGKVKDGGQLMLITCNGFGNGSNEGNNTYQKSLASIFAKDAKFTVTGFRGDFNADLRYTKTKDGKFVLEDVKGHKSENWSSASREGIEIGGDASSAPAANPPAQASLRETNRLLWNLEPKFDNYSFE